MKISERGQITIPKALREQYGLREDTEVELIPEEGGIRIQRRVATDPIARLRGKQKLQGAESVDEYIEAIRGR